MARLARSSDSPPSRPSDASKELPERLFRNAQHHETRHHLYNRHPVSILHELRNNHAKWTIRRCNIKETPKHTMPVMYRYSVGHARYQIDAAQGLMMKTAMEVSRGVGNG